jgi:hypothetical protein
MRSYAEQPSCSAKPARQRRVPRPTARSVSIRLNPGRLSGASRFPDSREEAAVGRGVAAVIVAKSREEGTLLRADADEEAGGREDGEHDHRQPVTQGQAEAHEENQ